eukprot:1683941-Pyramimonas_sp.AAC.2
MPLFSHSTTGEFNSPPAYLRTPRGVLGQDGRAVGYDIEPFEGREGSGQLQGEPIAVASPTALPLGPVNITRKSVVCLSAGAGGPLLMQ